MEGRKVSISLRGLVSVGLWLVLMPVIHAEGSGISEIVVAQDGSGDFLNVQDAVDAVPEGNSHRVVIYIRPGAYHEQIVLPRGKPFITFQGEDPERTILTYNLSAHSLRPDGEGGVGTTGSSSTFLQGDDFIARNITFANATPYGIGQAVAVKVEGDRMIFDNVRFIGWQDTLYAHGRGQTSPDPSRHSEYGSTGPGGDPADRADWSTQLTAGQVAEITPARVLAGDDGWGPAAELD